MTSLFTRLAGVLLSAALLGSASAQIDTVTSSFDEDTGDADVRAAVGAVLTIDGASFGTAKPKVFLLDELTGKKYVLKVTAFADAQITAEIKKAVAGSLTLNVLPKGATEAFTSTVIIETPRIDELLDELGQSNIDEASPGTVFRAAGAYLGTKKGKVKVGGKASKVLGWFNDYVLLQMPKSLANGLWTIVLDNKVAVEDEVDITMVGSTAKIGKANLQLSINGAPIKFKYTPSLQAPPAGAFALYATNADNPSKTFLIIVPFDIENDPVPSTLQSGPLSILNAIYVTTGKVSLKELQMGKFPDTFTWTAGLGNGSLTVQINASGAGQVAGTISGQLPLQSEVGGEAPFEVANVEATFVFDS